jgi:S1-C subfamily serine protease
LIQEVDRTPITSPNEFKKEIAKLHSGDVAALLVRRGNASVFVGVDVP